MSLLVWVCYVNVYCLHEPVCTVECDWFGDLTSAGWGSLFSDFILNCDVLADLQSNCGFPFIINIKTNIERSQQWAKLTVVETFICKWRQSGGIVGYVVLRKVPGTERFLHVNLNSVFSNNNNNNNMTFLSLSSQLLFKYWIFLRWYLLFQFYIQFYAPT